MKINPNGFLGVKPNLGAKALTKFEEVVSFIEVSPDTSTVQEIAESMGEQPATVSKLISRYFDGL